MKRTICFLLSLLLLLPVFSLTADAAAGDPEFRYELTVDGKETVEVNTGDIITVTLHLYRTDAEEPYPMYAMQDEIRYDKNFFELVPDSALLGNGIQSKDIALVDNHREFYMNYLSITGGAQWQSKTRVGSFQLKVTGESGVTTITNQDFLVSLKDGSGSYNCDANVLTVILTADCTVKFETNGGTKIDPIAAIYGETIARPADPVREGKVLVGWFKDIHLTEEWNFETDLVQGNMTLYAKWEDAPAVPTEPTVPEETVEGNEGGEVVGGECCVICGRENLLIPALSICWICLLMLLLILIGIVLFVLWLLWKRSFFKYSLASGDLELDYKNDSRPVQLVAVLMDQGKKYPLARRSDVLPEERVQLIRNDGQLPVAEVKPGRYQGKLIITHGRTQEIRKCRIEVIEQELKEKQ